MLIALAIVLAGGDAAFAGTAPYVVVYKTTGADRVGTKQVDSETNARERALGFKTLYRYKSALHGFGARLSPVEAERLRRDPEVSLVSPDVKFKALGMVPLATGESSPSGIMRIGAARGGSVYEPSSTNVAVIDTGADLGHPDLNALSGKNCIGPGPAQDDEGHGTEVAGIIAARNEGSGIVGVAPGTRIYAVKVLGANAEGSLLNVICGIDWVTANAGPLNIRVANLSIGTTGPGLTCGQDALHLAICNSVNAGVLYTVAAGNDGQDFGAPPQEVPAAFPEVLTVTAMSDSDGLPGGIGGAVACNTVGGVPLSEQDDQRWGFSDFATSPADAAHTISAPGVCIQSTFPNPHYAIDAGTSFAAPHVAGVAALCLGQGGAPGPCTGLSPSEMLQKLRSDAAAFATPENGFRGDPRSPLGGYYGHLVSAEQSTAPVSPALSPPALPTARPPGKRVKRSCTVPRLRGLRARRARTKLKHAHCQYRFRGSGRRVTSTIPKAGKRTSRRVLVRLSRRPHRRQVTSNFR